MSREIFRAEGPDVELVRHQLALNPPDAGTRIDIEYDEDGKATVGGRTPAGDVLSAPRS